MRFAPSTEAAQFATALADLLAAHCDPLALRAAWDGSTGRVPGLWARLAEVGLLGATVPEPSGGLGLDAGDLIAAVEETGRAAAPEPVVETLVGARLLAAVGDAPGAAGWLPRIVAGEAVLAVGWTSTGYVPAAEHADLLLLLAADGGLHAVPGDGVTLHPQPTADRGFRLARVEWTPSAATALAGIDPADGHDLGALLVSAQLVGLTKALLDVTVHYAAQREQFGRPVGSFQAVKHALADVYVGLVFARPVVQRAGWSVSQALPTRARDVSHAKVAATLAARRAARVALQVHGAIGYTFEHDLHIWLKRTWSLTAAWGDLDWHRARVAASMHAASLQPGVSERVP